MTIAAGKGYAQQMDSLVIASTPSTEFLPTAVHSTILFRPIPIQLTSHAHLVLTGAFASTVGFATLLETVACVMIRSTGPPRGVSSTTLVLS